MPKTQAHPQVVMHQLVQALPTPQTPTVHWTDVSKRAETSLDDCTSAMGGSLLQTVQTTVYFLRNWGKSWWCPNTNFVSYYKRFGRVMDTNRPRLCRLVSITGRKCV